MEFRVEFSGKVREIGAAELLGIVISERGTSRGIMFPLGKELMRGDGGESFRALKTEAPSSLVLKDAKDSEGK